MPIEQQPKTAPLSGAVIPDLSLKLTKQHFNLALFWLALDWSRGQTNRVADEEFITLQNWGRIYGLR